MKGINEYLDESKQELVSEVQSEYGDDYAYQTFAYGEGQKKFEYGFLTYNHDEEFFSVTAFNEDSEEAESFADQNDISVEELLDLKVGESYEDQAHGSQYALVITRIW